MLKELLTERDLLPIRRHNDGSVVTPATWSKRRKEIYCSQSARER